MIDDPKHSPSGTGEQVDADDLFGKLDSLMQKHQGRGATRPGQRAPVLTEPVEQTRAPASVDIPVLQDAVDPRVAADEAVPRLMVEKRRQLQVALYLRLRQRLDRELDAALADDLRLGAVALHPAFTRLAEE